MAKEQDSERKTKDGANGSMPFDFAKLLGPYSLAGVDYMKLLERERKNIAALTEANKIVFEGWQALIKKQSEIFQKTMARAVAGAGISDTAKSRAELAEQGFEKALDDMREIAMLAAKYQREAFDV